MIDLVWRLLALCRLRLGPQDMPYSPSLAQGLVLAVLGLEAALAHWIGEDSATIWPRTLLSLGMLVGPPWLLLRLRGYRARLAQTLIALAGTRLLFTLALLPLILRSVGLDLAAEPLPGSALLTMLVLTLLVWQLLVGAHILRAALEWPMFPVSLLVVGLFLLELALDSWLRGW